jgi:hypothetical protein
MGFLCPEVVAVEKATRLNARKRRDQMQHRTAPVLRTPDHQARHVEATNDAWRKFLATQRAAKA